MLKSSAAAGWASPQLRHPPSLNSGLIIHLLQWRMLKAGMAWLSNLFPACLRSEGRMMDSVL